ncbi:hypothetical protein FSARC_14857 [Fusarium sarcochroum]|uniref:NADP-dependent oxidoreductase domain-containing protein n=1 Tax=Fusarium sarcochroum TaxID=1208366 RepID=A0A8H4SQL3_9HYPO|nr:hypothetical protein FSARC_14857 [Fusarium sarcochroum]
MASSRRSPINLVLGAANIGDATADPMVRFDTPDEVSGFLNTFVKRGYSHIDTSRIYSAHAPGTSESRIGAVIGKEYAIDTKVNSLQDGGHSVANIASDIDASLEALRVDHIHTEYLHIPDRKTDFKEACEAMDLAYKTGKIKQWGICNHTAEEVETFLKICEKNGYVKPRVYQGQYNPIVRGGEKELLPFLRQHGMAFYAYSPAGAGFFAGNHKKIQAGGRFDQSLFLGGLYSSFYLKPSIMEVTDKALELASQHGIGGHAAALRWTAYHSVLDKAYGDSILIGASSVEQLETNIDAIEAGPLPDEVACALEAIYGEIDDEISYHM